MKKAPHKVIYLRAAQDIAEALQAKADEENRTLSNLIETMLRRQLEDEGRLPKEPALAGLVTSRASKAVASGEALAAAL